ncbi:unnamed protein product, partial [Ectocarpus sp. 6 AP-2014]
MVDPNVNADGAADAGGAEANAAANVNLADAVNGQAIALQAVVAQVAALQQQLQ